MSNPGVITLSELTLKNGANFRVEDNLCESIHFHYKDIRIDLTINELFKIADKCANALYDLIPAKNFCLKDYESDFLEKYAFTFTDLVDIQKVEVPVSSLFIQQKGLFGITVNKRISKRRALNLLNTSNSYGNQTTVVLFNDSNIVNSGLIEVAKTFLNNPKTFITVNKFIFDKKKYSPDRHPYFSFFFRWNKQRIKKSLKQLSKKFF